jgi:proline iminopeptidase
VPSLRTDDGRRLSWREVGSGPPLLCHPGGPGCSSHYFGDLPELARGRTLLLLDPRGTGDSDPPAERSGYDLQDYAADIEALRERLGLERLDVLGHSHGGFVAITWGGAFPERVGRLVLAATAARFTDAIREARGERVASHRGRPYFEVAVAALRDQQAGNYTGDDELVALYERAGPLYAPVDVDITPVVDAFRRAGINADALKHFNERIAGGMDLRPQLARVEAPTLVLAGEHDPFGGPTADELAAVLPNATLVTVAGADHFAFLEPEGRASWSRAVLDFLAD